MRGEGARCNVICTQPRRIAAISVARRVASERGERIGQSVGYQVRFEHKPPERDGSLMFCTTGTFLRRLQSDLEDRGDSTFLDNVSHVVVDEVHERDVDTDLLLFVLKRIMSERRRQGKREIKIILMSATIDPTLLAGYLAPPGGSTAPIHEIEGRSFPVEKHYLEEVVDDLRGIPDRDGGWVFKEQSVARYLDRELVQPLQVDPDSPTSDLDDTDLPNPLASLLIARVLSISDEGHVLCFLPGWDEIMAVKRTLLDTSKRLLGIDFNDASKYEIHLLHSSVPVDDQQAIFNPPPPGIRRIILSTNIAETSVTIPDVVYVVDAGKLKENRYDPVRRLSSLVTAWVGKSNLNQRAGRAGRHRPGHYFGLVSKRREATLRQNQTVAMGRVALDNVVMHVKALNIPIPVEDILAQTIEPPEKERVTAAIDSLQLTGALDSAKNLTSLGRVLVQLPVEVAIGKLCLLGSFFRCLDQALTLAAVLTNRDPFVAPIVKKQEAMAVKNSWVPQSFRSDPLAVVQAFNVWHRMQTRGEYNSANQFCHDNFLSKPTLLQMQRVKEHLLESLDRTGVLRVSAGGSDLVLQKNRGKPVIPESLNANGNSLALLTALIALALAPNFAIRASRQLFRTATDSVGSDLITFFLYR
jgi:HrpA-like RNA helicase